MRDSDGVPVFSPDSNFIHSARGWSGGSRYRQRGSAWIGTGETFQSLLAFERYTSYWTIGPSMKRGFDVAGALVLAIVFLPLLIIIPALIRRQGGGALFCQQRVGRNGRLFSCLKFRTMATDADRLLWGLLENDGRLREEWLATQKLQNDPRVTPLGHFLRRTSLDELPQLWNILRGDMSLVGPRPVVPDELSRYGRNAVVYLAAKPGLTGLWQVSGRNATTYRRRVALDVYYVRYGGPLLDLKILYQTAGVIFGARAC
jgi:lipopolysaccharide/colanic/teichoic acid biosynthesis glycosyltransferase